METIKFRFELNDKVNREGLQEVFLVITETGGKRKKVKSNITVKNDHFGTFKDVVTIEKGTGKKKIINKRVLVPDKWITSKDRDSNYKNNKLKAVLDEYRKAYDIKKDEDKFVDTESVIKAVNNQYVLKDVIGVLDYRLKELENDYPNHKGYVTLRMHIVGFLNSEKLSKVDFRKINREWLTRFDNYLRKNINNGKGSVGSVHTVLKRLRAIFNYAIKEEIITPDIYPFATYTLPKPTKKFKERLNHEELNEFEKIDYEKGTHIYYAQRLFLLAVKLAGTRIEDMLTLRVKNVNKGRITFNMKKGITDGKLMSFKITDSIQEILSELITRKSNGEDFLFPFLPPSVDTWSRIQYKKEIGRKTALVNKYLGLVGEDACIDKKITSHIARHSFASIALNKTKNINALKDALGHSSTKITEAYLADVNIENLDETMALINV